MEKQRVFIPVELKKEKPDKQGQYFTIHPNIHDGFIFGEAEFFDGNFYLSEDKGYPSNDEKTTHWLKEQEGYFFTADELIEFAKKSFREGDMYGCSADGYKTRKGFIESLKIR